MRERLAQQTTLTPVIRCAAIEEAIGGSTRVFAKLEFLQRTGTFKARGALATLYGLSPEQLAVGVTAVSAGNHAIATAFAAQSVGTTAKVVMIRSANPSRIEACRSYGAEVVLADDVHQAFEVAEKIQNHEGRYFVHPFEGPAVATATGIVGLEICEQCDDFDTVIVPVGGGGLIGGIANVVKRLRPACEVIGVEPEGADTMHRSLSSGKPMGIETVRTIADSLGAPFALPYSFGLCQLHVDRLAMVDDLQLRRVMGYLFRAMKIAVEPACAASTAALLGPLRNELHGKRVMLVMCGSNIDWATFEKQAIFDDGAD
ncbi:MAG: threonine/serine dehydratase [Woeseiaceae bacterium]